MLLGATLLKFLRAPTSSWPIIILVSKHEKWAAAGIQLHFESDMVLISSGIQQCVWRSRGRRKKESLNVFLKPL